MFLAIFFFFFLQCNWNTLTAIVWMQNYIDVGWWNLKERKKKTISGSFCSTCEGNVTLVWQRCQFVRLIHGRATWRSLFRVPPVKLPLRSIAQQPVLTSQFSDFSCSSSWVWWFLSVLSQSTELPNPVSVCVTRLPRLSDWHTFWFLYANLCW